MMGWDSSAEFPAHCRHGDAIHGKAGRVGTNRQTERFRLDQSWRRHRFRGAPPGELPRLTKRRIVPSSNRYCPQRGKSGLNRQTRRRHQANQRKPKDTDKAGPDDIVVDHITGQHRVVISVEGALAVVIGIRRGRLVLVNEHQADRLQALMQHRRTPRRGEQEGNKSAGPGHGTGHW